MNLKFWTRAFWSDIGYGLGSGPWLVRRIVSIANISEAGVIVELGAGFGQVTKEIISKKSKNTRLIVIENDHERYIELTRKFGDACEIYEMSAAHIGGIVGSESVDIIVSTLPLGSISHPGVGHILTASSAVLKTGGTFVQYQYALQNLKDVKQHFTVKKIHFEPRNIWPAFIYQSYKK